MAHVEGETHEKEGREDEDAGGEQGEGHEVGTGDELVFEALHLEAENGVTATLAAHAAVARASRIRAPQRLEKTRACARKIMAARPW